MRYLTRYLLTTFAITACASTRPPSAALTEARRIYGALDQRGASRRLDADMERTRAAIDRADSAAAARTNVEYINAVSDIALHLAQATEAKDEALAVRQAADSLRAARLRRLLSLSESQRAELASQNALSQAEVEALRERNLAARQREDSMRVAQNAAAGVRATEDVRADSLRRIAEQATLQVEAARTATEQERADSLKRRAELTSQQLDSARQASAEAARERDSLRTTAEVATRAADSLRDVATAAARARDSLSALNNALSALQTTSTGVRTVRQTDRGLVISLSGVLFDVGTSTLTPGAARSVRRIAEVLQQYPTYRLTVEGHTDSTGRPERNQVLSERRAESVKEALIAGGLNTDHIATQGYGATKPVASNATSAGRQQNRRVEIVVVGAG
jgi:outer membrane protein OmpA-like peptidoglycan-associated protein